MQAWRLLSQFSFCRISSSATTKSFIMMIIQQAEINRVCGGKHPTILLSLSLRNRKLWFTQTAVNTHQEYSHMHTHTWVCRLCFPCNTTTNIVWIVGCGMPQGFSKLMSSLSLSLCLFHSITTSLTQQQELAVVSIQLQQLRAEVVNVWSQSVFSQQHRKLLQLHWS